MNDLNSATSALSLSFTSIVNTRSITSLLFLQTLAAEAYLNHLTNKNISISVVNHPFPITDSSATISSSTSTNNLSSSQINEIIKISFGVCIFAIAFAFKFSSISFTLVK